MTQTLPGRARTLLPPPQAAACRPPALVSLLRWLGCAWAPTATRGSCTRNCSLRSETRLGPGLPSDRGHPRLLGPGPTPGGSSAREPDPQDASGGALAACTRREPPPGARGALASASPVELRTRRAGATGLSGRAWFTPTHLCSSPTGLETREVETRRRTELAWDRKARHLPVCSHVGGVGRLQAGGL